MKRRYVWATWTCDACHENFSGLSENKMPLLCPTCGTRGRRPDPLAPRSPTVLTDALWGGPRYIENFAPDPVWVATKSEYRRLCDVYGMENRVRHLPVPGTDKSPVTTSWDIGPPPGYDPRPFVALTPEEQITRRREAAVRLGFTEAELEAIAHDVTQPDP